MFFRKNNNISKCLSVKRFRLGFKTTFAVEKGRSTAALKGIGVLYLKNSSFNLSLLKVIESKHFKTLSLKNRKIKLLKDNFREQTVCFLLLFIYLDFIFICVCWLTLSNLVSTKLCWFSNFAAVTEKRREQNSLKVNFNVRISTFFRKGEKHSCQYHVRPV